MVARPSYAFLKFTKILCCLTTILASAVVILDIAFLADNSYAQSESRTKNVCGEVAGTNYSADFPS
jgi:hypothetical protein